MWRRTSQYSVTSIVWSDMSSAPYRGTKSPSIGGPASLRGRDQSSNTGQSSEQRHDRA
jgi:hypothetical protein